MKKIFFVLLFLMLGSTLYGQTLPHKRDSVLKAGNESVKKFKIEFTTSEFDLMIACAQYGFQPYIKTTTLPINQVDIVQQKYLEMLQDKLLQFKQQYLADSLSHNSHYVK